MVTIPGSHGVPMRAAERRAAGQALRQVVPRSAHATYAPAPDRADPVRVLEETGQHRIASLLPIRYDRMRQSPFGFLRGAAAVMAGDLATTPVSGIRVQSGGDCHLANFGIYASPEGVPVFDVNDFDETLPAPFEWDVKRLGASFAVVAAGRGLAARHQRQLACAAVRAYRQAMAALAAQSPLDAWRTRIDAAAVIGGIEDRRLRERQLKRLAAIAAAGQAGYPTLLERRNGLPRLRAHPPLLFALTDKTDGAHLAAARAAFASYKRTLDEERRLLLARYHLTDIAFKVVGVGSVGTFCAIGLYLSPDGAPLLLQIKEAQPSVLAPFAGASAYANQGQRVVVGQRIMQAESDIFLGWTRDADDDRHCYVRRLKDGRLAMLGEQIADGALPSYAELCGRTLARAHARSADAATIAGYLGTSGSFDTAVAEFAVLYARQTVRDHRRLVDAIAAGRIVAQAP